MQTLATLRKIDDFPLYEMRYYGDYGFEGFLQTGISPLQQGDLQKWACTCFAALHQEGEMQFGRNFDWYLHPALILFTNPPHGYASVSIVDISYLGFSREEPSEMERRRLLAAPLLPFDGMNEYGLIVGMMAVPYADSGRDPQKKTLSSVGVIRLLLDYAKNVDEALALLPNYNIDFSGGPPLHYLISDSSGDSVIVEFVNGEMRVLRHDQSWQVASNFVISDTKPEEIKPRCWRYNKASEVLEQAEGKLSQQEAMTLLENVSQSSTIWSVVYNMTTGNIQVVMGKEYREVHEFRLEMKRE